MSEIELVLIGPGYGESILINLGADTWVVVDSCVRKGATKSAALEYLARRGVEVASQVTLVVATHWHDDHVRGLASLLEAARGARFCCSVALRGREFRELADHTIPVSTSFSSGVDEFRQIMRILQERRQAPAWTTGSKRLPRFGQRSLSSDVVPGRHVQ
jgi:glyoxylase-like metal-dependent hydrolase (beta-lactamase superfamily II)